MSQGYGGGPLPPGYPPGGGAPPGYPPGGGGPPGYPPGGGGPPGYPPGAGYAPGAPPFPQGYPGAPQKQKYNPLLWVGLGCGTLLLLGLVAGGVAFYFTQRAAKQALESLNGVASAFGSAAAPGAPTPAPGSASGTCQTALLCCQKIVRKTGGSADAEAACAGLAQLNDAQCALTLKGYQSSAQLLGVTCE